MSIFSSATWNQFCRASFLCFLNLYSESSFLLHLPYIMLCFFFLSRLLWIYAASLLVRIKAHVTRREPRLDVSVHLAGLVLTVMCPMSRVKWQLHKGVNKHPLYFNISPHIAYLCLLSPYTCEHSMPWKSQRALPLGD